MELKEKVIKGLECCIGFGDNYCDVCPYSLNEFECDREQLKTDALVLLKAQEPVEPQEKREGIFRDLYCGACGRGIVGYIAHLTGIHVKLNNYCCKCGQAVKWDG